MTLETAIIIAYASLAIPPAVLILGWWRKW